MMIEHAFDLETKQNISSSEKCPNNSSQELSSACRELRQIKKKFYQFEAHLDQATALYTKAVLPKEKALLLDPGCELVEHLISFLAKPALTQIQRDALLNWLDSLIGNISRLDSALAESLRERVKSELSLMMSSADSGSMKLNLEELIHSLKEKSGTAPIKIKQPATSIDQDWITKIFRKTAQALHPDRETNAEQAQVKAEMMSNLLSARKSGDVVTIVEYYEKYVGSEVMIDPETRALLLDLIYQEIRFYQSRRFETIMKSQIRAMAYDRIYSKSIQNQENNIESTLAHLYEVRQSLIHCRKNIKNVSQLIEFLN